MIRPLVPADRQRLERLWIDTFSQAHPSLPRRFWEARLVVFRDSLGADAVHVFSMRGLERADGLIAVNRDGELCCLFVARAAQGSGAGSLLLEHLLEEGHVSRARILEENLGGRFFLQRHGFVEVDRNSNPVAGQQELLMERRQQQRRSA